MGSPSGYAQLVPKLRFLKAILLPGDTFKELIGAKSVEEATAILRDTPYSEAARAGDPERVQEEVLRVLISRLRRLERYAPAEARPLLQAFYREEEARDLLVLARAVQEGRGSQVRLPTMGVEGSLLNLISREPEALGSLQRLQELFDKTWVKQYLREATRIAGEAKTGEAYTWYTLALSVLLYVDALKRLDVRERLGVEDIVCPFITYRITNALINAKDMGLPMRTLDRVMEKVEICGFKWKEFRAVYEREVDPQSLLASLKEVFAKLLIDTKLHYSEALEAARKAAYKLATAKALAAYASYPFKPAIVAAAGTLAKIEAMDVQAILSGKLMRLPSEALESLVISL